jgi:hypothetical protein
VLENLAQIAAVDPAAAGRAADEVLGLALEQVAETLFPDNYRGEIALARPPLILVCSAFTSELLFPSRGQALPGLSHAQKHLPFFGRPGPPQ